MPSVKQGSVKYHFLSLLYDSTSDQTPFSRTISKHFTHQINGCGMDRVVHAFPKGISQKVNVIVRLESQLANIIATGQQFNHLRQWLHPENSEDISKCVFTQSFNTTFAQSAGAVEYTDCFSAEG